MQLLLFDEDQIVETKLPIKVKGQYWIKNVDGNLLYVEAEDGLWILHSYRYAQIIDENSRLLKQTELKENSFYRIYLSNNSKKVLIYVEPQNSGENSFVKKTILGDCSLTVGRDNDCDIIFENRMVSSKHTTISFERNAITVTDLDSSNGTYLNYKRIKVKKAMPGDMVFIMGLRIILGKDYLALNNPNNKVTINSRALRDFEMPEIVTKDNDEEFTKGDNSFFRSPRFRHDIEKRTIKVDAPPAKFSGEETPVILTLGPAIVMGLSSAFTALFSVFSTIAGGGNMMDALPSLIMAGGMLLGSIVFPIIIKQYESVHRFRKETRRKKLYRKYLDKVKDEISKEIQHEEEILNENFVDPAICVHRIQYKDRNLWERTVDHSDFLCIRLGIGNIPWLADLAIPERSFTIEKDVLQDELYNLKNTPKILENVPVTVSLKDKPFCGIIGDRKATYETVKNLIVQLSALHSYDELNFIFLYSERENEQWDFVKWLPHVFNSGRSLRFIARTDEEIRELDSNIKKIVDARKDEHNQAAPVPYYVVFALNKEICEKAQFINEILHNKKNIGFSIIFLYDELKYLPKECATVVEINGKDSKIYDKNDISGAYTTFTPDDSISFDIKELTAAMANIKLDMGTKGYTLPTSLTFLEMFGVGKIEHLNVLERWKENDPTKSLQCQIGVDSNGNIFYLDMHQKYHGPHGLVAGMTGSGKSEFIITLILSLAVNYHPYEVAFILIDYKGGGMANAFTELPHVVGTITNLDGAAVKRSLVAIESELKRRQFIFSKAGKKTGISNIDIYKYQKLFREGAVTEPLPHLFIISDEFAELKTQQPEFMTQLVSAARIGRSLGVHLILATQKPSGVVDDQIWSNTRFRVCLKVQEKQDSMDVIKRADAAELSVTGRFYLQVGYNELFELGQSAWSGAPYIPTDKIEKQNDLSVTAVDILGRPIETVRPSKKSGIKRPEKQVDAITKYLSHLAKEENISVKKIWLDPIPEFIYLDDVRKKYNETTQGFKLCAVCGEIDDPAHQAQKVMTVPISDEGNLAVYGSAGSGKTTFVTTLIYDLMMTHTPEQLNMYILDFSSETLKAFQNAPQVGDVLIADDKEKILHLFRMLLNEVGERKKNFLEFGGDYASYIKRSNETVPMILVVIHNYAAFGELFEDLEDSISMLTREGVKYGIYFCLTSLTSNGIRYRVAQNISKLYVLQMNDESDYSSILGRTDGLTPSKFKGRGLVRDDNLYEFQIAYATQDDDIFESIRNKALEIKKEWKGKAAKAVPVLPKHFDINNIKENFDDSSDKRFIVGISKKDIEPVRCDFTSDFINIVSSSEELFDSFMQGLAQQACEKTFDKVVVLDPKFGFTKDAEHDKFVYFTDDFDSAIAEMFAEMVLRNNTIKTARANGEEEPKYPKVLYLINRMNALKALLSDDSNDKLDVLLENGEAEYGINVVISDLDKDLSNLNYANWFTKHVKKANGIFVGGGIANQLIIDVNNVSQDMYNPIGEGMGYFVSKGNPIEIKLLEAKNTEDL